MACLVVLVPKLQLGNAVFEALLPYHGKLEIEKKRLPSWSFGVSGIIYIIYLMATLAYTHK